STSFSSRRTPRSSFAGSVAEASTAPRRSRGASPPPTASYPRRTASTASSSTTTWRPPRETSPGSSASIYPWPVEHPRERETMEEKIRIIDELDAKVGGRFKLTALLQKRIRELVAGAPRLVEIRSDNPIDVAIAEVRAGKIELVTEDAE